MVSREELEETVFTHARKLSSAQERDAYLRQMCDSDPELRQRVQALLQVDRNDSTFLVAPIEKCAGIDLVFAPSETIGSVIGAYELIEEIGAGGMGIVFLARQTVPIRRDVALKIIRPGMDSDSVIRRFQAERQVLAQLHHPGMTRLLDAGTTDSGRPWFVMELARGPFITDFCRQHRLSVTERLKLFESLCDVVRHAHENGILHRDLKPSNVIVTSLEGRRFVKVIDFGVAVVQATPFAETTCGEHPAGLSAVSGGMMGTPAFMSPEQTWLPDEQLDDRCDVYALGVLLYEMLTGQNPFGRTDWRSLSLAETLEVIRDRNPPLPSQIVRTENTGSAADPMSGQVARSDDPPGAASASLLKGDLDRIIMKAIAKDRDSRYATVAALSADIRRYLHHEPVEANPPTHVIRLRKLVRRRRARVVIAVLSGGLLGLLLLISTMTRSLLLERAELERQRQLVEEQYQESARQEEQQKRLAYGQDLRSAFDAYFRADFDEVHRVLDLYDPHSAVLPEDLTTESVSPDAVSSQVGFEYHLLRQLSSTRPQVLKGSDGAIFDIEFSRDDRLLASSVGSRSCAIDIWDPAQEKLLRSESEFPNDVNSLYFSGDGQWLFSGEESGQVRCWNVQNGLEDISRRITNYSLPVGQLYVFPDNQTVLASQIEWGVQFARTSLRRLGDPADLVTLEPERFLAASEQTGVAAFSKNNTLVHLRRLSDLSLIATCPQDTGVVCCGRFSRDGRLLALGSYDGITRIWKVGDLSSEGKPAEVFELPKHASGKNVIRDLAFSSDGHHLVAVCNDCVTDVWEVDSRSHVRILKVKNDELWSVAESWDGTRFAAGYTSGNIQIHQWADVLRPQRVVMNLPTSLSDLSVAPDGDRVASLAEPRSAIQVYSTADGELLNTLTAPEAGQFTAVTWSEGGQSLWAWTDTHQIVELNVSDGKINRSFAAGESEPNFRFVLQFDRYLAGSGIWTRSLRPCIWDLQSGQKVFEMPAESPEIGEVIWGAGSRNTFFLSRGGELIRWDVQAGEEILPRYRVDPRGIEYMGKTADPDVVLISLNDATLFALNLARLEVVHRLKEHRGIVCASAVSPDGRTLATGTVTGNVTLWKSDTWQPLCELQGLSGAIVELRFAADGRRLIGACNTVNGHGRVVIWDSTDPVIAQP